MKPMTPCLIRKASLFGVLLLGLAACSSPDTNDAFKVEGERVSALEAVREAAYAPQGDGVTISLNEPALITEWAQAGGKATHAPGHMSLGRAPTEIWDRDIGSGSRGGYKLLAQPIVAENKIFAMDARGMVSAYRAEDGRQAWEQETRPASADEDAIGGGVSYDNGVVYAATGFGEVLALRASDGAIIWRRMLQKPIRSAPTISDGRLFVIDIENETTAIDTKTSFVLWHHKGIAENATLMGSSSPAVDGDTVVVAYSSGEIFGLRAQNGRVVWSEVLAVPKTIGALPAIADIRGLPVIDAGRVYATSHSGRTVSLMQRTGNRAWEADIGGINTPFVSGDVVFMLSLNNHLLALDRELGRIIWSTELPKLEDPEDKDSKPVFWWGPVLAGGRLWLTSSHGSLASYDAVTGLQTGVQENVADAFFMPPIVANLTLYLLADDGTLIAMK
ncbi:MAG: pyrrolo-quinoline quinone [Proteobacteria bacterium]|nr:pyrrolo-quinoline quinone [Pseudomonadota bacterium]